MLRSSFFAFDELLAAKDMSSVHVQVETLRQELERERSARKRAEAASQEARAQVHRPRGSSPCLPIRSVVAHWGTCAT